MDYIKNHEDVHSFAQVKSLNVIYDQKGEQVEAVKNINLDIKPGEFNVIIGPSGCGKSTLLYVLSGLLKPQAGEVYIDGQPPTSRRNDTALILQDYGLLPWKTVEQNVALGLLIRGYSKSESKKQVGAILTDLAIDNLAKRFPAQLSGGQRQRVAIARSLALKPRLLLMDEPFSSLDALTRESLQGLLLDIWEKTKLSILLVTHNIEEAVFMGQRIFVMSKNPGTIINTVDNPMAGDISYRGKKEFYDRCSYLRSLL